MEKEIKMEVEEDSKANIPKLPEAEGEGSGECKKEDTGMKVVFKKWTTVAAWKWKTNDDDVCGICRLTFECACPDCRYPGDDCPIVFGTCRHYFHMHCIVKWLSSESSEQLCPMCRQEWKFLKIEDNSNDE